jgi:hypothetical protein
MTRDAEHSRHVDTEELVAAPGDDLVEHAHGVAHAAGGFTRDDRDRGAVRFDLLGGQHLAQPQRNGLRRN